jgi:SAM-dependent methyltransferase
MGVMTNVPRDQWTSGDAYEFYMGRWSRALAREFLAWLAPKRAANWLDLGCGTGALTAAICEFSEPASVVACDPAAAFVEHARSRISDPRASFVVAGADTLPKRDGGFDAVVSGLVLNFVQEPKRALEAVHERLAPNGVAGAYVWDYESGLEFLRHFWDEAAASDPRAAALDEGARFPLCHEPALAALFESAGLTRVDTKALVIETRFRDFDDYWRPFLGGTGPAPTYVGSLGPAERQALKERLERRLRPAGDGTIRLRARAWAARGVRP